METEKMRTSFGVMDAVSVGWNVINVWGGLCIIFVVGFNAGGIPAIFYGFLGCSVGVASIMAIFAECSSYFATSGGAYHFTAFLTPSKYRRVVSYVIGAYNYFGYILTYAACSSIVPLLVFSLANLCNPDFDVTIRWRLYLLYILWATIAWAVNIFGLKIIGPLETAGCWVTLVAFVGFSIAMLVIADKPSPSYVFVTVFNNTGYSSNAMAVVIGLFNTMTTWMCLDGPVHLSEEIRNPIKVMPKIVYMTAGVQITVGILWILVVGFSITDMDVIVNTSTGVPIVELIRQATKSTAAAIVFNLVLLVNIIASLLGVATTTSRQGMAFARDGGLFWNQKLSHISPRFGVPIGSITLPYFLVLLIGLVFCFSSLGFNAIIGSQALFMMISFVSPAVIMLLTKRSTVPKNGRWNLGRVAYPICIAAVIYGLAVIAIVPVPQVHPITGKTMNYVCVIFVACTVIIVATWLLEAHKTYKPPNYDDYQVLFGVEPGSSSSADVEQTYKTPTAVKVVDQD